MVVSKWKTNPNIHRKHKQIQSTTEIEKSLARQDPPSPCCRRFEMVEITPVITGWGEVSGEEGGYCKVCPLPTHIHVEDDDQTKAKTQIHTETG